jgi:tetratricopeptide (TPR) repeat protein
MISTRRHLEYASGFIELGMFAEAAGELAAIPAADRNSPEVLSVQADFHMQAKQWEELITTARAYAQAAPEADKGWIYWAYALRELGRVTEAQTVLLEAEPRHGATCAVLHYNLACYACLLGDKPEAKRRLTLAFKLGSE